MSLHLSCDELIVYTLEREKEMPIVFATTHTGNTLYTEDGSHVVCETIGELA